MLKQVARRLRGVFITVVVLVFTIAVILPIATQAQDSLAVLSAASVYDAVSPSTVALNVVVAQTLPNGNGFPNNNTPFNNRDLPQPEERYGYGSGSGFVIDQQGHIVTNAHVVEGATRIEVMFLDGTKVQADVVGIDAAADIAVIKVALPAEDLIPVTFADSDTLDIGQEVFAIGSPFGQRWTLTSGIISALDRTIPGLTQFSIGGVIQTDAAINPGNSGGPLLDVQGQVIGVNSQIRTTDGSSAGIGFAVPSNLVQRVAQQLIAQGFVEYSYLGIQGGDVSLAQIETLGLANNFQGVLVQEVAAGGPAARAGLQNPTDVEAVDGIPVAKNADIITAINGTAIRNMSDLIGYLARNTQPGDTVTLEILRNGTQSLTLDVMLTPRPA